MIRLLKLANIADTGGQAKMIVDAGVVRVNGIPESRKRRQIQHGDRVSIDLDDAPDILVIPPDSDPDQNAT